MERFANVSLDIMTMDCLQIVKNAFINVKAALHHNLIAHLVSKQGIYLKINAYVTLAFMIMA